MAGPRIVVDLAHPTENRVPGGRLGSLEFTVMLVNPDLLRALAGQTEVTSSMISEADAGNKVSTAADGLSGSTTQWAARLNAEKDRVCQLLAREFALRARDRSADILHRFVQIELRFGNKLHRHLVHSLAQQRSARRHADAVAVKNSRLVILDLRERQASPKLLVGHRSR